MSEGPLMCLKRSIVRQAYSAGIKPDSADFEVMVFNRVFVPERRLFKKTSHGETVSSCFNLYREYLRLLSKLKLMNLQVDDLARNGQAKELDGLGFLERRAVVDGLRKFGHEIFLQGYH